MSKRDRELHSLLTICDSLYREISNGWSCHCVARELNAAYFDSKINQAFYFFNIVYHACLSEAILSLAKLTDPHKDAITIYKVMNRAGQYLNRYVESSGIDGLEEHNNKIITYADLVEDIRTLRDKAIAHTDRDIITKPEHFNRMNEVRVLRVGEFYMELQCTLNFIREQLEGIQYDFNYMEIGVKHDIDILLQWSELKRPTGDN